MRTDPPPRLGGRRVRAALRMAGLSVLSAAPLAALANTAGSPVPAVAIVKAISSTPVMTPNRASSMEGALWSATARAQIV